MLKQIDLRFLFSYDEKAGILKWRYPQGNARIGVPAGNIDKEGYSVISVLGQKHRLHRVIWVYNFGDIPPTHYVDHINGDKLNNRLANLRLVTSKQSAANRGTFKSSKTGVRGVCRKGGKYTAQLQRNGVKTNLGVFNTIEEASSAYRVAAEEYYGEHIRPL